MVISYARFSSAKLFHARVTRHINIFGKPSTRLHATSISNMKRKATDSLKGPKAKRAREPLQEYCDAAPQRDEQGSIIWPASAEAIERARSFLREWYAWGKLCLTGSRLTRLTKCGLTLEDAYCTRQRRGRPRCWGDNP